MTDPENENDLLAIEVDADDYAETAAGDTPTVSRTYQSEADFQNIKGQLLPLSNENQTYRHFLIPLLR